MCRKLLWVVMRMIKPTAHLGGTAPLEDPDINADVRNAAQRFSSSARLVALKAARDQKETGLTLEKLKLAQEAISVANDAVKIVERGHSHGPG
jgi:hypothetical protein